MLSLNYGDVKGKLLDAPIIFDFVGRLKTGVRYRACIGEDACFYLDLYLASRINLEDDSPLFASEGNVLNLNERVTDSTIHQVFKNLATQLRERSARARTKKHNQLNRD